MKYLVSSWAFVILHNIFCVMCLGSVHGNLNKFCFNHSENYCNFTTILHVVTDENHTYSNIVFPRIRTTGDSTETLTESKGYCSKEYLHNHDSYDPHLDNPENYDTLTQSDIVRNQYMTLPYPAVSHQQLEQEKIYYDTEYKTRKRPYTNIYSFTFEALNHFLFKGRNTFRFKFTFDISTIINFTNFIKHRQQIFKKF